MKVESKVFDGKIDQNKDLMVEINIAEAPMFSFAKTTKNYLVKDLLDSKSTSSEAKKLMNGIYANNDLAKVDYRKWMDSKGMSREMIISSSREFPDSYAMDVFFGLISLLIKDNSPLVPDKDGFFKFKINSIRFTLNELCEAMEVKVGGKTYDKIREALRQLKSAEYYSLGSGTVYNKIDEKYEVKGENAISILESYSVSSRRLDEETGKMKFFDGEVKFGSLIMANLELGFARVLRNHQYFKLKSGIGRGLYLYIESNRNSKDKYIKRSFEVLKNKIPVDFDYPSRLKLKLKKALDNLIEMAVIKDYFYADEFLVNGVKEQSIYIIFKGNKHSIIKELEEKGKAKAEDDLNKVDSEVDKVEDEFTLEFPKDIKAELEAFGINEQRVANLINSNTKYELAKYILWMKDGIKKGKVKDPAGLFVFAMTPAGDSNGNMVKVENTHAYIVQFIEAYKRDIEGKNDISEKIIIEKFNEYIEDELIKFKEEDEFAYAATKEAVLSDIEATKDKKIKAQRQLYNMATSKEDKNKILCIIEKWESFSKERDSSEIFKEMFIKRISSYRGIDMYEEFKRKYIQKNS
ncbi:MAG: replication initiator protein A [Sarcina sp.]